MRGATKEKSRKLDELKAKRKAKDDKKRVRMVALLYSVTKFNVCPLAKGWRLAEEGALGLAD